MPTKVNIAKHLDMSERNAHDVLNSLADKHGLDRSWWQSAPLTEIRFKYIRDLREKAAGRGGDDQVNLTKQRAEESAVKTAMMRLDYQKMIGALVLVNDSVAAIKDWCVVANREYQSGFQKLVGEIQSEYKIKIDNHLVENIAGPTLKRIQSHAANISRNLTQGSGDIHTTEGATDSGMD